MADSEEQEKKPVSIALKTGTAVDVQFSSDEEDDDEAHGVYLLKIEPESLNRIWSIIWFW